MNGSDTSLTISVFSQSEKVGTLSFDEPSHCIFTYDDFWVKNRFAISPCLPLNGQYDSDAVNRFIRNLFPEGEAFDLLLSSQNLSKQNLYAILSTIGRETTGVLSFFENEFEQEETQLRPISDQEIEERLSSESAQELVVWDGKYRLSVAGVQNKLNVFINDEQQMLLANGAFASTHILKFTSQQFKTIIINELVCMRLAKEVRLQAASVDIKQFGEHKALVVKRFDRKRVTDGVKKRHVIDGCQALNLPPEYKYEQNFGAGEHVAHIRDGASFKKLFEFAQTCAIPALTTQRLIDWLIFNLIIGNSDTHGKNVSFFVSVNGIDIAPFYDLVSVVFEATNNKGLDTSLAMAVGDNFDINTITAFELLSLADDSNISFSLLRKRIERMTSAVMKGISTLLIDDNYLNEENKKTIEALKTLISQRANHLLEESKQMKKISKEAF